MTTVLQQSSNYVKLGDLNSKETPFWKSLYRGDSSGTFIDMTNTCRLDAQVQAVKNYHAEYPAAFFCGDAFSIEDDNKQYKCGFFHLYYSITGQLCGIKITPTGRITQKHCCDAYDTSIKAVNKVLERFGAYRG